MESILDQCDDVSKLIHAEEQLSAYVYENMNHVPRLVNQLYKYLTQLPANTPKDNVSINFKLAFEWIAILSEHVRPSRRKVLAEALLPYIKCFEPNKKIAKIARFLPMNMAKEFKSQLDVYWKYYAGLIDSLSLEEMDMLADIAPLSLIRKYFSIVEEEAGVNRRVISYKLSAKLLYPVDLAAFSKEPPTVLISLVDCLNSLLQDPEPEFVEQVLQTVQCYTGDEMVCGELLITYGLIIDFKLKTGDFDVQALLERVLVPAGSMNARQQVQAIAKFLPSLLGLQHIGKIQCQATLKHVLDLLLRQVDGVWVTRRIVGIILASLELEQVEAIYSISEIVECLLKLLSDEDSRVRDAVVKELRRETKLEFGSFALELPNSLLEHIVDRAVGSLLGDMSRHLLLSLSELRQTTDVLWLSRNYVPFVSATDCEFFSSHLKLLRLLAEEAELLDYLNDLIKRVVEAYEKKEGHLYASLRQNQLQFVKPQNETFVGFIHEILTCIQIYTRNRNHSQLYRLVDFLELSVTICPMETVQVFLSKLNMSRPIEAHETHRLTFNSFNDIMQIVQCEYNNRLLPLNSSSVYHSTQIKLFPINKPLNSPFLQKINVYGLIQTKPLISNHTSVRLFQLLLHSKDVELSAAVIEFIVSLNYYYFSNAQSEVEELTMSQINSSLLQFILQVLEDEQVVDYYLESKVLVNSFKFLLVQHLHGDEVSITRLLKYLKQVPAPTATRSVYNLLLLLFDYWMLPDFPSLPFKELIESLEMVIINAELVRVIRFLRRDAKVCEALIKRVMMLVEDGKYQQASLSEWLALFDSLPSTTQVGIKSADLYFDIARLRFQRQHSLAKDSVDLQKFIHDEAAAVEAVMLLVFDSAKLDEETADRFTEVIFDGRSLSLQLAWLVFLKFTETEVDLSCTVTARNFSFLRCFDEKYTKQAKANQINLNIAIPPIVPPKRQQAQLDTEISRYIASLTTTERKNPSNSIEKICFEYVASGSVE